MATITNENRAGRKRQKTKGSVTMTPRLTRTDCEPLYPAPPPATVVPRGA